jgi:pimeloyl-ACP methyl ester carboxylesterase
MMMLRRILALAVLAALPIPATTQAHEPSRIHVNGVDLHYIERGSGEPLILIHGGTGDYSSWEPQMETLSGHFRVIAYSRRYSYPNHNPAVPRDYSALVDAEDLAALIQRLDLHRVRLVGQSIGASVALAFAARHPELAHSMVLGEPPAHGLISESPQGKAARREFMATIWNPAADAFAAGNAQGAMRILVNGFSGADRFDDLAPAAREAFMRNAPAMAALTASSEPFEMPLRAELKRLRVPALIVTGENTLRLHKLVNAELIQLLPESQHVTIPNAGHGSPRENPTAYNAAVLAFLLR